jgi:hypothetical protein
VQFTAEFFYDFESLHVWRIYRTLIRAVDTGRVTVHLDWSGFAGKDLDPTSGAGRGLAASEVIHRENPAVHERFIYAMMQLGFQDGEDLGADKTLAIAAKFAGIEATWLIGRAGRVGADLLGESTHRARELGVVGVPTAIRHGSPVLIKTSPAADSGDPVERVELMDRMLRDDGIWSMAKP